MAEAASLEQVGRGFIDALAHRPDVRDVWFNGKTVKLDGFNFWNCRFDNCRLEVSTFNFEMHRCFIDNNSKIRYYGEIIKVLRLFNSRYDWAYKAIPDFCATRHEDGTISIELP